MLAQGVPDGRRRYRSSQSQHLECLAEQELTTISQGLANLPNRSNDLQVSGARHELWGTALVIITGDNLRGIAQTRNTRLLGKRSQSRGGTCGSIARRNSMEKVSGSRRAPTSGTNTVPPDPANFGLPPFRKRSASRSNGSCWFPRNHGHIRVAPTYFGNDGFE